MTRSVAAWSWVVLAVFAGVASAQSSPAPGAQRETPSWRHYEVIVQRNMFTRRRQTQESRSRERGGPANAPPAARAWVFTGTAIVGSDRVAFLEDTRAGTTIRAREGQVIEVGRIVRITPQQLQLEVAGRSTVKVVAIGSRLDGSAAAAADLASAPSDSGSGSPTTLPSASPSSATAPAPAATAGGATSGGATSGGAASGGAASGGGGGDQASIIERMRARRRQETGGRE